MDHIGVNKMLSNMCLEKIKYIEGSMTGWDLLLNMHFFIQYYSWQYKYFSAIKLWWKCNSYILSTQLIHMHISTKFSWWQMSSISILVLIIIHSATLKIRCNCLSRHCYWMSHCIYNHVIECLFLCIFVFCCCCCCFWRYWSLRKCQWISFRSVVFTDEVNECIFCVNEQQKLYFFF